MTDRRSWGRSAVHALLPLVFIIPLAYLLRPVFWEPLDDRFYSYFHSKRAVPPWTDVVVIGIDRATRDDVLPPPVYPLSRHTDAHATVVRNLRSAGARAIVIDLELGSHVLAESPTALVDALADAGEVYLVTSMIEENREAPNGAMTSMLRARLPDSTLAAVAAGVCVADVETDPDGVVRRFSPDPRLGRMGVTTVPERLSGFGVGRPVPIELPSVGSPLPVVSYGDVLENPGAVAALVQGRIAFVGLTEDPTTDFVGVPRLQDLGHGIREYGLPGVVLLAAITETLIRDAPIADATWPVVLVWNLLWCVACVVLVARLRPTTAFYAAVGVIAASLTATGFVHALADLVLPAGLLFGCVFLAGAQAIVQSYVDTTRLLHREEAENERVRKELEVARRTQERFLPDAIPEVPGIDLWGINVSCLEVSGDYYDIIDLGDDRPLVVTIADVSGKGLPAALLMSSVQAGLHCSAMHDPFEIGRTAETLNRLVCRNTDAGRFVTFFIAELDRSTHRLRYVRAGHDSPVIVSRDGSVRTIEQGGLVLGFMPDADMEVFETELDSGDVLCLYTDGITEARNPADEEFELDGVKAVVAKHREDSARGIGQALIDSVREFSHSDSQADDVTIVVLKVL